MAAIALVVAGKRLNATGSAEDLVARWARDDVLVRLVPDVPSDRGKRLRPRAGQLPSGGTAIVPRAIGTTEPATVADVTAPSVAVTSHSSVDGRPISMPCRTV